MNENAQEMMGCSTIILALGVSIALIVYSCNHKPEQIKIITPDKIEEVNPQDILYDTSVY